jgi:hypothetical protein
MTTITAPLRNITLQALLPDVVRSCIIQQPSPPPDPGEEPPAPVVTEGIYTPVAPGVTYSSLPVVTIIDTSPARMIGCIITTADNPQGRLDALFPSAINGDGVIERSTNDIWVYSGTTWNNVGPTPGPTIVTATVIPPWNEISIFDATVRIRVTAQSLAYALEILTEVPAISVKIKVGVAKVNIVQAVTASITLDAEAPQISISARVDVPVAATSLNGVAPQISAGKVIQIPAAGTEFAALPPDLVGRPRTSVFVPQVDITVTTHTLSVATGVSIAVPSVTIALQAQKPSTVGKLDAEAFDLFLLVEDDLLSLRNP